MEVGQIRDLLTKKYVYFPGSKDFDGNPLIIFPSLGNNGEFLEPRISDLVAIVNYFANTLTDKSVKFTVLIDMRKTASRYLKSVLKVVQQSLVYRLQQVIIIKPDQFFDKSRIGIDLRLEVYEFKV